MIDFRSREILTITSRTCMFGDYRLESRSPVYIGDVLRRVVGRVLMCVYITHHVVCTSTLRTIRTGLPKNPQKILISYLYL